MNEKACVGCRWTIAKDSQTGQHGTFTNLPFQMFDFNFESGLVSSHLISVKCTS